MPNASTPDPSALYLGFFEQAVDGIFLTRPDGSIIRSNPAACRALRASEEEIVALGRAGVVVDEPGVREMLAERRARGLSVGKIHLRRSDGTTFPAEITSAIVPGPGGENFAYIIFRDVTERERADAVLQASEARFRNMADSAPVKIWLSGPDRRCTWFNRRWLEFRGRTMAQELGDGWTEGVHPDDLGRCLEVYAGHFERRELFTTEFRLRRHDGAYRWVVDTGTPLLEADGAFSGFIGSCIDVTEQRAVQAKLAESSRLAALGTLVAGIAHEINNPLVGQLSGGAAAIEELEELQRLLATPQAADKQDLARRLDGCLEALRDAQAGARRIARIVKDLTVLGRPDLRRARTSLMDTVQQARRWMPPVVAASAELRVVDRHPPDVMASGQQMEQALVNLLANAARAIPAGRAGVITVTAGPGAPGMARLEVEDNGEGMTPELMARMFDPFFTTREVGQGMGLGLPVARSIVTAHGGTITATSRPGQGTTFRIELPAV